MSRKAVYLTVGVTTILVAVALISTIWGHYRLGYSGPRVYRRKKVVAFGDSITQHGFNTDAHGWIAKLADWWTRRVDVLNRGYSGYNSRWAKIIFEEVILAENPDFLFIFFGANDAIEETALHHVPLAEYSENIRYMVNVAKQRFPTMSIVLITPPPIYEEALLEANRAKGRGLDRTNERTLTYVESVKKIGQEFSVPVVDAWNAMEGSSSNRGKYLPDGLHLNANGNLALLNAVKNTIRTHYHDWVPEVLKMQLPEWSQIDYLNPSQSFQL